MGWAEGVGVGWSEGVGVGSDGEGELDGEGDPWALATGPRHGASESRRVVTISADRTLVAGRPVRSFIDTQALFRGITQANGS